MKSKSDIAISFLRLAASGQAQKAFKDHASRHFKHHNPHYPGDGESLMNGMIENAKQFPDKELEVQRVLEEGNLVAVHSRIVLNPGGPEIAVVHIFRFEGGLIAELWDIGMTSPDKSPNEFGMF